MPVLLHGSFVILDNCFPSLSLAVFHIVWITYDKGLHLVFFWEAGTEN